MTDQRLSTEFSADVLDKARRIPTSALEQDADFPDVWWVQGGDPDRRYRVQFGKGFVTCTCPHGLNVGAGEARCKHVATVLMSNERRRQYAQKLIDNAQRES